MVRARLGAQDLGRARGPAPRGRGPLPVPDPLAPPHRGDALDRHAVLATRSRAVASVWRRHLRWCRGVRGSYAGRVQDGTSPRSGPDELPLPPSQSDWPRTHPPLPPSQSRWPRTPPATPSEPVGLTSNTPRLPRRASRTDPEHPPPPPRSHSDWPRTPPPPPRSQSRWSHRAWLDEELTKLKNENRPEGGLGSGRRVSNPRHSAWKADALPTELLPREATPGRPPAGRGGGRCGVDGVGFEPTKR
jgi:hypothetical protein